MGWPDPAPKPDAGPGDPAAAWPSSTASASSTPTTWRFTLAPRLNAAGRLGSRNWPSSCWSPTVRSGPTSWPDYIDGLNASRQTLERSIYLAANKQAKEQFDPEDDAALVLADHGWHAGVIGIVAGRLAEKYHRPVVLIAWDALGVKPGLGSARSVPGFNLHAALRVLHGAPAEPRRACGGGRPENRTRGLELSAPIFASMRPARSPTRGRVAEL